MDGSREPPPGVTEVGGDPVTATLRALAAAGELAKGSTQLISIAPIRERLADRWPQRMEQVWDQVVRVLHRLLGADDLVERLDDTSFLVIQFGASALHSQIACIRATSELMHFFLGAVTPATVRISNVLDYADGELVCTPLDERQLRSVLDSEKAGDHSRSTAFPVLTKLGRSLSVDLSLSQVFSLRSEPRLIGHFAQTVIHDAVSGERLDGRGRALLQPGDLADLDCKVLGDALDLQALSPQLRGSVIVPISYFSLANTSARYRLLQFVRSLPIDRRRAFIWEIVDLEAGVPVGRLSELISIAAGACRGVICRMDLSRSATEKLHRLGATLSVGQDDDASYTEHDLLKLEAGIAGALHIVPSVLLHGVPRELMLVAGLAGGTHCAVID
ncbi:MAG TPA: hypothetical protein VHY34_02625 [Caulobacteraceae bacterium]|nr:hypothetical protein [Caulobacteraceae bacterium]